MLKWRPSLGHLCCMLSRNIVLKKKHSIVNRIERKVTSFASDWEEHEDTTSNEKGNADCHTTNWWSPNEHWKQIQITVGEYVSMNNHFKNSKMQPEYFLHWLSSVARFELRTSDISVKQFISLDILSTAVVLLSVVIILVQEMNLWQYFMRNCVRQQVQWCH